MRAIVFKTPDGTKPLSEANAYSVTVFHDDGRVSGWGLTLVESVEIAQLAGRAVDGPADIIRMQAKTPGAVITAENPLQIYTYVAMENSASVADWIDRKVFKAATAAMQAADNQIPDV